MAVGLDLHVDEARLAQLLFHRSRFNELAANLGYRQAHQAEVVGDRIVGLHGAYVGERGCEQAIYRVFT